MAEKKYVSKIRINKNSNNEVDIAAKYDEDGNSIKDTYATLNDINEAIAQNKLTAGDGIKIVDGVISIDIPNGDEVAY